MAKINLKHTVEKVTNELRNRKIKLLNFKDITRKTLYGEEFSLPVHNEERWLKGYIKQCIKEGMNPEDITPLARESYALLRYKQALAGSSGGTSFESFFAMFNVPTDTAKVVYNEAKKEFDSGNNFTPVRYSSRNSPRAIRDYAPRSYVEAIETGLNFYVHEES